MNSNIVRATFFLLVSKVITRCAAEGIVLMPFRFYGTKGDQERFIANGKSLIHNSKHLRWKAIDFVLVKNGEVFWEDCPEYQRFGEIAEEAGLSWGGRITELNDVYHIQMDD
jgi:hypothetical protein